MKKPISRIASAVQASATLKIDAMFKKMQADGLDVVGFGAGEPDFPTPDNISSAGIKAIQSNQTKYTPASGLESLRKAVCGQIMRDYGVEYAPSQVLISSGAKHNIFIALMTLCDPGDEVILPAPYWVTYAEAIAMAGAKPIVLHTSEAESFKLTPAKLDAAVTAKTKALILNSPSNPTGMVYNEAELRAIADVCVKHGIYVIADEIYDKLLFDGLAYTSFAALGEDVKELTVLINGVSKSFSMTGWRIGWACANPEISKVMAAYQSHSTSGPATMSQLAALEALSGPQDTVETMRVAFEKRRDYFVGRVNALDGVSCLKPDGAFYLFMNIRELLGKSLHGVRIDTASDFAALLLEKAMVAVVPCESFGIDGYLRWSYATSMENICKGMDRFEQFIKG